MANVLLINPPLTNEELFKRGAKNTASILPPLGLAYIAAVLEKDDHRVEITDGIALDISIDDIVHKTKDFDFIGITVLSSFYKRCVELIEAIKKVNNVPIIVGGVHATVLPGSLLECGADFAIIGEGEETTRELISVLQHQSNPDLHKIKGIAFLENGNLVITEKRPLIDNLDSLPIPARHLLPMQEYKTSESRSNRAPCHSMIVSRGCQGTCSFCCKAVFGTKFRCLSPARIVAEMFVLRDQYRAQEIAFWDDTFTTNKNIVLEVCNLLLEKKLNIPWSCEARVDTVDEEMLTVMKKAGCEFIAYGVESGCDQVLKSVNKRVDTRKIENVIRMTQKIGIPIRGYFMLGFCGETEEQMHQTIRFAIKLNVDYATFTLLHPFPGSADYIRAQKDGSYFDPDFYRKMISPEINFPDKPIFSPKNVSPDRLMEIHKEAYLKYYYRPSYILNRILKIRSLSDINRYVKGGLALIRK